MRTGINLGEAADDCITQVNGTKWCMMFDMGDKGGKDGVQFYIARVLSGLKLAGFKVKNIYFYDHGGVDKNNGVTTEMGSSTWTTKDWQDFGKWWNARHFSDLIPSDCTIHMMQCYAGADNQSLLKTIASAFNCTVEGCDNVVQYGGLPAKYDPKFEKDGPDCTAGGTVWRVKPGQEPEAVKQPQSPM